MGRAKPSDGTSHRQRSATRVQGCRLQRKSRAQSESPDKKRRASSKRQKREEEESAKLEAEIRKKTASYFQPNITGVADYQFRAELERMMGSEVIRLNDKTWSKRFTEKLLEDYYRYEEAQAKRREEEERLRVHKLKVLGLIQEPEKYDRRLTSSRFKMKKHTKTKEELAEDARKKQEHQEELLERRLSLNNRRQTATYGRPSLDIDTKTQLEQTMAKVGSDADDESPRLTSAERKKRALKMRKFSKVLPSEVQKIYFEETVDGLYKMAESLVHFR